MKHYISHLLHLSHSQWICRNITLHDKLRDTLLLRKREDVLKELDDTDREEILAERRFLLEFDFDSLLGACGQSRLPAVLESGCGSTLVGPGRWGIERMPRQTVSCGGRSLASYEYLRYRQGQCCSSQNFHQLTNCGQARVGLSTRCVEIFIVSV
jgi:hypothetical protein